MDNINTKVPDVGAFRFALCDIPGQKTIVNFFYKLVLIIFFTYTAQREIYIVSH